MATSTGDLIPLEDYLHTTYRPDCDWIDGEVRERSTGEWPHAGMQGFIARILGNRAAEWNIWVLPEQRVQTSARHFRIPDVCAVSRDTGFQPILRTAPLLCVEVLSREDSMSEIQERVEDYLAMGVRAVWMIDPRRRKAYMTTDPDSLQAVPEFLTVPSTEIRVKISEAFAELEQMGAYGTS
jgi:Uma2 family endonuclease